MIASSGPQSFLASASGYIECIVCHEIYTNPKTLPCGHTFCQHCIQDWINRNESSHGTCPECREVFHVPFSDVSHLKTNVALNRLCETSRNRHRSRLSKDKHLVQNQCSVYVCLECKPIKVLSKDCGSEHQGSGHNFKSVTEAAAFCRIQVFESINSIEQAAKEWQETKEQNENCMLVLKENMKPGTDSMTVTKDSIEEALKEGETRKTIIQEQLNITEVLLAFGQTIIAEDNSTEDLEIIYRVDDFLEVKKQLVTTVPRHISQSLEAKWTVTEENPMTDSTLGSPLIDTESVHTEVHDDEDDTSIGYCCIQFAKCLCACFQCSHHQLQLCFGSLRNCVK